MIRALEYLKQAAFMNKDNQYRTIEICASGVILRRHNGYSHDTKKILIDWIELECSEVNPVTAALERMK